MQIQKRTCTIDSSTCQAITKCCIKCKNAGHYPQSSYCKFKKKVLRNSKSKSETFLNISRSTMLSKDVLLVVNSRINQLEMATHKREESRDNLNHEKVNLGDLIPFVLMYICLNLKFIISNEDSRLIGQRQKISKEEIFKSAGYCARKFVDSENLSNPQYFLRYCNKKIKTVLKKRSTPDAESNEAMQNILNVYDNVFYKAVSTGDQGHLKDEEDISREDYKFNQHGNKENLDNQQLCGYNFDLTDDQSHQQDILNSFSK